MILISEDTNITIIFINCHFPNEVKQKTVKKHQVNPKKNTTVISVNSNDKNS
jgi:hypothetical protein